MAQEIGTEISRVEEVTGEGAVSRYFVAGDPLVTLDPAGAVVADGACIVSGNRIEAVGPAEELRARGPFDEELGGAGNIVMPGLWNSHFHSEAAFWPGVFDHIYEQVNIWVHEAVAPTAEEDIYWNTLNLVVRAMKSGTTGFLDFFYGRLGMESFGAGPTVQAFIDSGARAAVGLAGRDQNKYVHADDERFLSSLPPALQSKVRGTVIGYAYPWEETAATFRTLADKYMGAGGGRFRMMLNPDWSAASSNDLYISAKQIASEYGATLQTHLLETKYEMIYNVLNHGTTGGRRLADIGFLGPDVGVAHFVWPTDDDIKAVIDSGATVVHNPGSNLRLTSGISPVRVMLDAGAKVAIGTDSISAGDEDDPFEEIRLAGQLQRSNAMWGLDSGRVSSLSLLYGAAHHGPALGGFGEDLGVIAAGNRADMVVLDRRRIFPPGKFDYSDPLDVIVDRARGGDVSTSIIDGRVVIRDRKMTTVDEDEVAVRCREAAARTFADPPKWLLDLRPIVSELEPYVADFFRKWDRIPIGPRYVYNTKDGPQVSESRG
jgi:5-methylthioadenosine/S-adenosylhomocysteine deaminase